MSGIAKGVAGQHIVDRGKRLMFGLSDDHAFTGRQAVRLDHDGRALGFDVGFRLVDGGKGLVFRRWDVVTGEKVLAKGLGASN